MGSIVNASCPTKREIGKHDGVLDNHKSFSTIYNSWGNSSDNRTGARIPRHGEEMLKDMCWAEHRQTDVRKQAVESINDAR